ncbi:MAG: hypothetical protein HYY96_02555 [Candidatus Tectomicrobia bacterium]|nr:hypothetical protein [Candidatus Tectomicrobia bacterium]
MRLLLYAVLILIAYYVGRNLLKSPGKRAANPPAEKQGAVINEMVKCPVCGTYVPQSQAIVRRLGRQAYACCSEECAASLRA